jgi:hypothetical protein
MRKRLDFSRESYPFFFYQRVAFLQPVEYLFFKLDYGYNFVIQRIAEKHNEGDIRTLSPQINIELIEAGSGRKRQGSPVSINLISSPCEPGVSYAAEAAPVDTKGFSVNMTATPRKIFKALNIPFCFADSIKLQISGQVITSNSNPALNYPSYADVLLEGRYYPEKILPYWGER